MGNGNDILPPDERNHIGNKGEDTMSEKTRPPCMGNYDPACIEDGEDQLTTPCVHADECRRKTEAKSLAKTVSEPSHLGITH